MFYFHLQVCGISLPLPPKKLIGNMDREFIAERQRGLQAYLDSITQHPLLCSSLFVKKFLDPNNYSANYTGEFKSQHQNVTLACLNQKETFSVLVTNTLTFFLLFNLIIILVLRLKMEV